MDVEIAAALALTRLGERTLAQQLDLVDEIQAMGEALGTYRFLELYDVFMARLESDSRARLWEEIGTPFDIDDLEQLERLFKDRGLTLRIQGRAGPTGRICRGTRATLWELITKRVTSEGIAARGSYRSLCWTEMRPWLSGGNAWISKSSAARAAAAKLGWATSGPLP